ncbi:2Fe-2S iron-sulfur cluster-binding protein [Bradyrhizobium sp. WSM1253]|uniref:2Fe-2S iron-sulfur cluster-binding protein n=1 Tax=Bradyrhizobium sp. WSM1253 TaxID=319003 RepID=UPI00025D2CEC|nr:2Fe-2S iron-sulfur cluster-binding protein [Bradyrhizobium sp. WSM1253]EIG62172.1 ferredoxin [Bradyrhizobium sp. WSM1253]
MPSIKFVQPPGSSELVQAREGESAMEAATQNAIPGILAECGGNAMCATCHVYVDDEWLDRLPSVLKQEEALLTEVAAERRQTSRLSCQVQMTSDLDGLLLHIPNKQI